MIDSVLQYQRMPYDFMPRLDVSIYTCTRIEYIILYLIYCHQIIAYITSVKSFSDNELYDLSVAREPSKR